MIIKLTPTLKEHKVTYLINENQIESIEVRQTNPQHKGNDGEVCVTITKVSGRVISGYTTQDLILGEIETWE